MNKSRLEAFSDGVLAIIITIMVLELKVPHSTDLNSLLPLLPVFISYVISFIYIGIYWDNHHHMLHTVKQVSGAILWANLHLLFWLSLVPFVSAWLGENYLSPLPVTLYGVVLLMAAIAYFTLQNTIIKAQGKDSLLLKALGKDVKGWLSLFLYISAILLSFWNHWISDIIYGIVAFIWLIPDRRIERLLTSEHEK